MLVRIALAGALICAVSAPALAQSQAPPLTIRKQAPRLDAGRVVAPGSIPTWARASADAPSVLSHDSRWRGPLQGRMFADGPARPIAEFATPRW